MWLGGAWVIEDDFLQLFTVRLWKTWPTARLAVPIEASISARGGQVLGQTKLRLAFQAEITKLHIYDIRSWL
jgi:hypothetical protein